MNEELLHFIVIDDSKLDCFIAEKMIKNTGRSADIKSFTLAKDALEYIKEDKSPASTIILVDIQMPIMNGFEFVETFETLPEEMRGKYVIYMLSSSINESDLNRVQGYKSIRQFLNKPLTAATLANLLSSQS